MKINNIYLILLIFLIFFINGCAPKQPVPISFPKSNFEITKQYSLDELPAKPDKPIYILLDINLNPIENIEDAEYFAFSNEEFKKIIELSEGFNLRDKIIKDQVVLVNLHINTINQLKELIHTQEVTLDYISKLYSNEQYQRQLEKYDSKWSDIQQKVLLILQSGVILGLIFL